MAARNAAPISHDLDMHGTKGKRITLLAGLVVVVGVVLVARLCREEIRFWMKFENLGKNGQGYPEYRHRQTEIVMVRVPRGASLMGSSVSEVDAPKSEKPQRRASVTSFLIGKYEVTQAQWQQLIGTNPSHSIGNSHPVDRVSWTDASRYCSQVGLSLPTEEQWEYACRAGTEGSYGGIGRLDDMGWYRINSGGTTHPVGQKKPNAFGLHDMHGNVSEWARDLVRVRVLGSKSFQGRGPRSRGGNFRNGALFCRSASRLGTTPDLYSPGFGFRVVFNLPGGRSK